MKTLKPLLIVSVFLLLKQFVSYGQGSNTSTINYFDNKIILKVKQQYRSLCSNNDIDTLIFMELYKNVKGVNLAKKFSFSSGPIAKSFSPTNQSGQAYADLSLIYEFEFSSKNPLQKVIRKLEQMNLFEYVEPHYIPKFCFTPNDSAFSSQYALMKIQAEAAWEVNATTARGDTAIVIGITDTGIDPNHPDLINQIKHNYNDPIDGIDNDNDGYIDNFSGWNLGENTNDPSFKKSQHGVHVSGIAAAATNNGIGIAGVGFNCKLLPINIADTSGKITSGYEGIVYAADHGCDIINCSWGGGGRSKLGQDVITYASINKNCLVVAAAGNGGAEIDFFPADYQYVLSVASSNSVDSIANSSNYGYQIDVCAPGVKILSTHSDSAGYKLETGTSMASPCVAGAAAIVKSFYPTYNAIQVGEQLKTTCDSIPSMNDSLYENKLGGGRINLFKALTNSSSPSIVMTSYLATDKKEDLFFAGDTIHLTGNFTNYLAAVTNLRVSLSSTSEYIELIDSIKTLGMVSTLGTADNNDDSFKFTIRENTPSHYRIILRLTYTDSATSYLHTEFLTLVVNVGFINIDINDVAISITDNGRIGYYEPEQKGGLGFTYKNSGSLFYEAGLMVGNNGSKVSDGVRAPNSSTDNDFQSLSAARQVEPAVHSEFDVEVTFMDSNATLPLPVFVKQSAYAWSTPGNRKYIILKYLITNTSSSELVNLYAGLFVDWDIDALTFDSNRIEMDALNKLAYASYSGENGIYAGIKLLSNSAPIVHYAIDHVIGGKGGVDIHTEGFDGNEKYQVLSTNRDKAGKANGGNDVVDVLSSGPFIVSAGATIEVAFAIIAGDNLTDLQQSAIIAQINYEKIANILANNENPILVYPNPTSGVSTIDFYVPTATKVELNISNILGQPIQTIFSKNLEMGTHRVQTDLGYLESGCYIYQIKIGEKGYKKKIIVSN